jgi:hypothetical protein
VRPVLTPAARRLWRDRETLQLGQTAGRPAVLAGVDPATRSTLALLDGTRERQQVVAAAAAAGCPPSRTEQLLAMLESGGLLEDATGHRNGLRSLGPPERERLTADLGSLALVRGDGGSPAVHLRAQARVLVVGAGRVGAPLAGLLAAAGVGAVDIVDDEPATPHDCAVGGLALADVGRSRGQAARDRLSDSAPSAAAAAVLHPDLVVLAPARPDLLEDARARVPAPTPSLLAEVRETVGVVGPLVLPGRTTCLRCVDLTRSDLDPDWPTLAAQLATRSRSATACDSSLAMMVAAQASLQVLSLIDGTADPATLGGTLELALPDWRWRRRSWPVHPDCGCLLSRAG